MNEGMNEWMNEYELKGHLVVKMRDIAQIYRRKVFCIGIWTHKLLVCQRMPHKFGVHAPYYTFTNWIFHIIQNCDMDVVEPSWRQQILTFMVIKYYYLKRSFKHYYSLLLSMHDKISIIRV